MYRTCQIIFSILSIIISHAACSEEDDVAEALDSLDDYLYDGLTE